MLITVNVQIFIIMVLFILTKQIKIYGILMLFTLVHELAHMFMGIILKLKPKELNVSPFGFSILFEIYEKNEIKKILIAICGPLVNILIALICYFTNIKNEWVELIIYSNILIGLFNLLPIYPLDGGRCIKSLIHIFRGNKSAIEYTNHISNICVILITMLSSIGIYYYKNIAILLILIYLWTLVIIENKKYNTKKRIYKIIENS